MALIRLSKSFHTPKQLGVASQDLRKRPGWGVKGVGNRYGPGDTGN